MSIEAARFTHINEGFTCCNCGFSVPPAEKTCRDHCPRCLYSMHVDVNPGDRLSLCGGKLVPIGYAKHKKKGYMILYRCEKCKEEKTTRFLDLDKSAADNFNSLLLLTPKE